MIRQSLFYFVSSAKLDPVTLILIFSALASALFVRSRTITALSLGILAYLAYLMSIGGDFMSGRFLAAPLLLAVGILIQVFKRNSNQQWAMASILCVLMAFIAPQPTFTSDETFPRNPAGLIDANGVTDERGVTYQFSSLLWARRNTGMPTHPWVQLGLDAKRSGIGFSEHPAIGYYGYFAGPNVHVLDSLALSDPLLARLPAQYNPAWRIGHFARHIPAGYRETLASGKNQIVDPQLRQYYDRLKVVISSPIWSIERIKTIALMNLGRFDHLLNIDAYRFPGMQQMSLSKIDEEHIKLDAMTVHPMGVEYSSSKLFSARSVSLGLASDARYEMFFFDDGELLGRVLFGEYANRREQQSIIEQVNETLKIPSRVQKHGFNRVRILPQSGSLPYRLSSFKLNRY